MYSDKSRDPTAMTFRLPEGETLRFEIKEVKKRYIRELSSAYTVIDLGYRNFRFECEY